MLSHRIRALISAVIFLLISVTKGDGSCGDLNLTATTTPQEITSPGYPDPYEKNITCHWDIYLYHGDLIKIEVVESDLDSRPPSNGYYCGKRDHVLVRDGIPPKGSYVFCGRGTPTYPSKERSVSVVFRSQISGNGTRFRLRYSEDTFQQEKLPTVKLSADTEVKTLTNPRFGYTHQKFVHMSWRIESTKTDGQLYIRTLYSNLKSLGCGTDSNNLLAFDGHDNSSELLADWCETKLVEKTASGKYIYIVLNTKPSNDVVFRIQYGVNDAPSDSASLDSGAIAGLSIGVIAVIGITFLVGWMMCKRYRSKSDRDYNIDEKGNPSSKQSMFEEDQR